jgi:aminodeoxyfutalosine deaminase
MDASERSKPRHAAIQSGEESPQSQSCRLTSRYIFPGDGPPIEHGTLEITGGIVSAVHNRRDSSALDLGNAAIIPGLVNAHTHLEFSDLPSPIPPPVPFTDWVRGVVAYRRARSGSVAGIIQRGLEESLRAGTVCVGEIATAEASIVAFRSAKGRPFAERKATMAPHEVVFRELLGFAPENVEPQLAVARSFLDAETDWQSVLRRPDDDRVQFGLSPHAPYSVHPELFAKVAALAAERNVPLAVHLAETREELEFLDRGTGPLAAMLRAFGAWSDGVVSPGTRALDYLRLLERAPRVAVVHGNYLADDELEFLSRCENFSLVYCPRTHAYFRHEKHPWRKLLASGGNVAVGTDSRASNPDLSLWGELCFLRQSHPEMRDVDLLRLGTVNGAAALGLPGQCGSLHPGRSADLAVVELRGDGLFHEGNRIASVMIGGRWL